MSQCIYCHRCDVPLGAIKCPRCGGSYSAWKVLFGDDKMQGALAFHVFYRAARTKTFWILLLILFLWVLIYSVLN